MGEGVWGGIFYQNFEVKLLLGQNKRLEQDLLIWRTPPSFIRSDPGGDLQSEGQHQAKVQEIRGEVWKIL